MSVKTSLSLIDPTPVLATALASLFDRQGEFSLDHFSNVDDALLRMSAAVAPEVVIVSGSQAELSAAAARLRTAHYLGPLLGVSSDSGERREWHDDISSVLAKPVRFGELVATIRQLIRAHVHSDDAIVQIGGFRFMPAQKILQDAEGRDTKLTDKEAAILQALHRASHRAVTRDMLLEEVWGYNSGVTTHTLETHIYRLRQKMDSGRHAPQLLITDHGGYRLARPE